MPIPRLNSKKVLWLFMLTLAACTAGALGERKRYEEYEVKAAFLVSFASFVEWPEDASKDEEVPLKIGILGEDPFGKALDRAVSGRKAASREVCVVRKKTTKEVRDCHIVFINASEESELATILDRLRGLPILTVTDVEDGASMGAALNFVIVEGKVRFEVNQLSIKEAGLKISSKLLKLAKIVEE